MGSDVVWDFQSPAYGHDPVYFGGIPELRDMPMMSYAASAGSADVSKAPDYCNGLKRFVAHAVRGNPEMALVENVTGARPPLVVDPTWLHPAPLLTWRRLPSKPYVLLYGAGITAESAVMLRQWCDKRGLLLVTAATPCPTATRVFRMLSPFEWVDLFRNAKATVVGSLHGAMYSIKYHKPFILLDNPRTLAKVSAAIERVGASFRIADPINLDFETLKLLDPGEAPLPAVPDDWLEESRMYLKRGLERIANSAAVVSQH